MSQTIRHYVKRRVWGCAAAAIGGWLVIALGWAGGSSRPDGLPQARIPNAGFPLAPQEGRKHAIGITACRMRSGGRFPAAPPNAITSHPPIAAAAHHHTRRLT